MSDAPKVYTERDLVLARRDGYRSGVLDARSTDYALRWSGEAIETRANRKYPLPEVRRPRVVSIPDKAWAPREFRYVGGQLQSRTIGRGEHGLGYEWTAAAQITPTTESVRVLADLIARPNETVEADE